jgi:hypothetical protein
LICCSVGIPGGLIGSAPAEKIKGHDPARGREPGKETVIEMQIVWKAMYQDDGGSFTWILTRVDAIGAALYHVFCVG